MGINVSPSDLLRREILLSLFVIAVASTGLGMVTWASFTDSDGSQQNNVGSGTLDVSLDGSDQLSAAFSIANGKPGSTASYNYTIRNNGSISADHLEVAVVFAENDSLLEPSDPDLGVELNATETASLVNVTQFEYRNGAGDTMYDALSNVNDQNGNGIVDVADVRSQRGQLDNLAAPQRENGNSTYLVIAVEIADDGSSSFDVGGNTNGNLTGYDEDIMADGIDIELTFTLNQAAEQ